MGKKSTIFCDIDGTLIKYRIFTDYKTVLPVPISNTICYINSAYVNNHHIVLTTARPEYLRFHTIQELDLLDIKYHQLVMSIERGNRILINDNEVKNNDRCYALNLERNVGLTTDDILKFNKIINT